MRIYQTFKEAIPEIRRDLAEMGIKVHPKSYQDKVVADDQDFETLELQNYIYTVVNPALDQLNPTQPWTEEEWKERLSGICGTEINPGRAWELRKDVWQQFLQPDGKFAYTYSERMARNMQVMKVERRLGADHDSRQLFVSIWDVKDTSKLGGISRVPCSIGYLLQCRKDKLNITYLQRSCDFATHFTNDAYLALRFLDEICKTNNFQMGTYTHWIGSLHLFRKDAQGVF